MKFDPFFFLDLRRRRFNTPLTTMFNNLKQQKIKYSSNDQIKLEIFHEDNDWIIND